MKRLFCWGVSLCALTPAFPAIAQSGDGVEEIIVTAQKRAENVQDVPIAIAAISGEAMQSRGVTEVAQLANYTPSVQLSNSSQIVGSPSSLSGFIRGIGQDDFSAAFEPGVGTYVDGVYLARTIGANASLLDVERIEILKDHKAPCSAAIPSVERSAWLRANPHPRSAREGSSLSVASIAWMPPLRSTFR
ncbi:MAG: TonB-dependent receptor plug domain-containing protein [Novosphingobium sp.]